MPLIHLKRLGGHLSIQDLGRRHSMHHGVTESGAADIHAFLWANRLLGRAQNCPMLEITLGNMEIEFLLDCQISLTGADLSVTSQQKPISSWQTHCIKRGETLTFGFPQNGLRAYLAINANLDLPTHYASQSNVLREHMVGALVCETGTLIHATEVHRPLLSRAVPKQFIPSYQDPLRVEVMLGYQAHQFTDQAIAQLLATEYKVRPDSNRMAYRLEGLKVEHGIQQLFSEGIAYGAIQIPPDGQPVILLNERQTMGGYPKVGCITRLSGAALAQRMPGSTLKFEVVTPEAASKQLITLLSFFRG